MVMTVKINVNIIKEYLLCKR